MAIDAGHSQAREMDGVDQRIDRLTLLCEGMWEVMCDLGATPEMLAQKMNDLDMADGRNDLKRRKMPSRCECGAMVPPKSMVCQFCSGPAPVRSFFDPV